MTHSRRSVLRRGAGLAVAGTAASLAGCSGTTNGGSGGFDAGYAAFFTLNDWANQVAGDHASFEDPVDVGQLGHGWTPDGNLAVDVASTDAFVYLDSSEFSWAQDLAATLEDDYDTVAVIDGLAGLEEDLLEWDHSHDEEEEDAHDDEDSPDDEDGPDRGQYDPHVWVDPVLAADVVDTIAAGLGEADPDNADDYADNAAAYAEDLDAIDDAFESIAENAERGVAVMAGHNSFQYLEARYGFRLHSPVGVSPQNEPTQSEIADTIELVNTRGSTRCCTTASSRPGSPSRSSRTAMPPRRSPSRRPGTTREWNDAGYGYLEQMTEINVPAFERAFDAQ